MENSLQKIVIQLIAQFGFKVMLPTIHMIALTVKFCRNLVYFRSLARIPKAILFLLKASKPGKQNLKQSILKLNTISTPTLSPLLLRF